MRLGLGISISAPTGSAWNPTSDPSVVTFVQRPDYAGETGVWTATRGSNFTGSPAPTASSGAPVFDGVGYLDGASLASSLTASAGSVALVVDSTNADVLTTATPYSNPAFVTNAGQGTFSLSYGKLSGVSGFMVAIYDGTAYRTAFAPASSGVRHSVVARYNASSLEISVDGAAFVAASPAPTGNWNTTSGAGRLGAKYDATKTARGTMYSAAILNAKASDAFAANHYAWAQANYGVA